MKILSMLSSQTGDKTEESNRSVAALCLKNPALLKEIAAGMLTKDPKLNADCVEVMVKVAEENPRLIVQYLEDIIPMLKRKETKIRWEAMHGIALLAHLCPAEVEMILPDLEKIMEKEKSTIVRDYATETLARYAGINKDTAIRAMPLLKKILVQWEDKHAARVFEGMYKAYLVMPSLKKEVLRMALEYGDSPKGVARKAAQKIIKTLG